MEIKGSAEEQDLGKDNTLLGLSALVFSITVSLCSRLRFEGDWGGVHLRKNRES